MEDPLVIHRESITFTKVVENEHYIMGCFCPLLSTPYQIFIYVGRGDNGGLECHQA